MYGLQIQTYKIISIYFLEQEVLITNFGVWPYLVQFWVGKHWGFGTASWTLSDYVGLAMNDPIIHGLVPSTLIWNFFGLEQKKSTDDHTNVAHIQLACTQTFFYFFFLKTLVRMSMKHRNERGAWERKIKNLYFLLPHPYPLALNVNKSPAVFIFYDTHSMDFEGTIEDLWTG